MFPLKSLQEKFKAVHELEDGDVAIPSVLELEPPLQAMPFLNSP